MSKKILVIASGGDAPGMNACVESIWTHAQKFGWQVFGGAGYTALIEGLWVPIDAALASGISHMTACVVGSSRSKAFGTPEGIAAAVANAKASFDAIVVLGGNGSLKGAWEKLERNGVNVIGIPATIDNDVFFTKNSLGFSSAVEEGARLVDNLNGTMRANERDHVIQIMGWHCDELTKAIGEATFADIIDVNENRHSPQQIAQILERNRTAGKGSSTVLIQEKVDKSKDRNFIREMHEGVDFWNQIAAFAGDDIRGHILGHTLRGAAPSARDRWLGFHYGRVAVELIQVGKFGVGIGLVGDDFTTETLEEIKRRNFDAT
ncbi:MAG: 6-phosphofructokinase [Firmicutes bacterium]|nr:6-phosphofructokinase [Bacillota bacterium]